MSVRCPLGSKISCQRSLTHHQWRGGVRVAVVAVLVLLLRREFGRRRRRIIIVSSRRCRPSLSLHEISIWGLADVGRGWSARNRQARGVRPPAPSPLPRLVPLMLQPPRLRRRPRLRQPPSSPRRWELSFWSSSRRQSSWTCRSPPWASCRCYSPSPRERAP